MCLAMALWFFGKVTFLISNGFANNQVIISTIVSSSAAAALHLFHFHCVGKGSAMGLQNLSCCHTLYLSGLVHSMWTL